MIDARLPKGSALQAWDTGLRTTGRFLPRLWDAASIYLPIVLMGLLALATYWMVQRSPVYVEPDFTPKEKTHEVDFFMRGAVIKSFGHDGRLQNQLSGRELRHYGDGKAVEIDEPRLWVSDERSRVMTAVAQWARVRDDGSQMELKGQAVVVREPWRGPDGLLTPRQELRGDLLIVDTREEWIRSPGPVVLISHQNRFTGDSLNYDHRTRIAELRGRVRATLVPR